MRQNLALRLSALGFSVFLNAEAIADQLRVAVASNFIPLPARSGTL